MVEFIGRAAAQKNGITRLFKEAGDPDLVKGVVKDVHTQTAVAEKSLKHTEKLLATGTVSDVDPSQCLLSSCGEPHGSAERCQRCSGQHLLPG